MYQEFGVAPIGVPIVVFRLHQEREGVLKQFA